MSVNLLLATCYMLLVGLVMAIAGLGRSLWQLHRRLSLLEDRFVRYQRSLAGQLGAQARAQDRDLTVEELQGILPQLLAGGGPVPGEAVSDVSSDSEVD